MNRRRFAVAAISSTVLLAGCNTEQKPSSTATPFNNSGIQESLKSLAAAIDDLVGDISEFDTENWREVVPKVTSSAENVSERFEALRRELIIPTP
jgi:outer membrane murein-binding lipoprotein Lpp